jgi:hypothetical protein
MVFNLFAFRWLKTNRFANQALPANTQQQKIGDPEGARTLDLQRDRLAF